MVDLNIDNYELHDILNLFKIPQNFDEQDLKIAKQIVLKTHPDKSNLGSEYFRFYSKAYKILFNIWEFRKRGDIDNTNKNTEYDKSEQIGEEEKKILLVKMENHFSTIMRIEQLLIKRLFSTFIYWLIVNIFYTGFIYFTHFSTSFNRKII